jgi:hypothetical protein
LEGAYCDIGLDCCEGSGSCIGGNCWIGVPCLPPDSPCVESDNCCYGNSCVDGVCIFVP